MKLITDRYEEIKDRIEFEDSKVVLRGIMKKR